MRALAKTLLATVAVVWVLAGGLGLALAYAPAAAGVGPARGGAEALLERALPALGVRSVDADDALGWLAGFPGRFVVGPLGLVVLIATLLPGGRRGDADTEDGGAPEAGARDLRQARKEAARIARRGVPHEAAELCLAVGLQDDAVGYFVRAEEYERAAEVRHDQNRFLESAELYQKAGKLESAGAIFAQQEQWERAADAYLETGNVSVAAEMYEKAGQDRRAAQCYRRCEFHRHAAKAYIRCEDWVLAAECLEKVIAEEGAGHSGDAKKVAEHQKLVRMTGNLYERAGRLDLAGEVLAKGKAFVPAAEIFERSGNLERAAELYLEGRDAARGAALLERLGQAERAARVLADHHRDRGNSEEAARQFERAGEWLEAGDLYRLVERYDRAGECYERFGDGAQAAEMFGLAGDRERAAENYERAGRYGEAAELFALAGDSAREAELLEKAGECLRAGRIHLDAGRTEAAIGALQKVAADSPDYAGASALLGTIFRDQQQHSLAAAKLREAVKDRELDRESVDAYYALATVHEAQGEWADAHALYEKIVAFDVHHGDAAERLERARAQAAQRAEAEAAGAGLASGAVSGRYIIGDTLGRGGMGIVYKAEDTVLDRVVAFKVLPESLKENPQALKNFLREAKSAAQLNHPNIVTVYDAGEQDGVYYIAMEYVDGNTLKDIIKHRGKIAPRGIVHVVSQMCEALAYAHEKKIVHRDIKTANAMWTRDRKAKIMDFGLAKVVEEVRNHTTVVSGTPFYMSPEQTLGKNVDHRSDLYSLGVSMFEMATGTLPFTEGNLPYHHVHTPAPDPRELVADLPEGIARIILRCLLKDPDERYASAKGILAELRALSAGAPAV